MTGFAAALSRSARAAKYRGACGSFVKRACCGTRDSVWLPRHGCHQETSACAEGARSQRVAGLRRMGRCLTLRLCFRGRRVIVNAEGHNTSGKSGSGGQSCWTRAVRAKRPMGSDRRAGEAGMQVCACRGVQHAWVCVCVLRREKAPARDACGPTPVQSAPITSAPDRPRRRREAPRAADRLRQCMHMR